MQYFYAALLCCVLHATLGDKSTTLFEKCHYSDNSCMMSKANELIKRYGKGNSELGLKPLNAIAAEDVDIVNSPGAVYIHFILKNQVVYGFENASVTYLAGFDREPELGKLEIKLHIPRLLIRGNYDLLARGVLLNTNSTGTTTSDFQNVRLSSKIKAFIEFRNNKRYLKIYDLTPTMEIDRWILTAENIYKENSDLTLLLVRVINDKWLEFWNEVEPAIVPVHSRSIRKHINEFFDANSYDELFLPDV
ncbi:circadian clock-controlled protein-like [Drosophila busckii]|uniref:circadian clock-controlled protein-like n=1 Tax=Drosophila busckii TaxID=30019 RepID=UPI00083ECB28|nr:circadian clock-controlled protein-like [Drosophila busckii]